MSKDDIILYEVQDGIAILTFNRPKALNALNSEVNLKLVELFEKAGNDDQVKVVILTGSGEKAFVAGADIKEMMSLDPIGAREFALRAKRAVDAIYKISKPVIAAINGFCLGGGLEYAMACDFRVASGNAKFGLPEITLGIMPGSAGTQRLPRLVGLGRAKELVFTGTVIDAKKALDLNLINHIYSSETLLEETISLAGKITSRSPVSLALIKSAMDKGTEMDLEAASLFEIDCFGLCFATEEQKKSMEAFANKNKG
jgi:enoyl-CoA hydratase